MNEQKAPNRNPGDVYLTAEEQAALMTKIMPSVYDPTPVRNKVLDIQYGTLPEQKLDLYLPEEGDGPFPVIFDVHGGGWMLGSKREGFVEHKIAALEKYISALETKREAIMTDFASLIQLYNDKYVNDMTVSVMNYQYKAPSLLSGAFIKETIKIAGVFCVVGFIVCMILLINSRRKEEKA